MVMVVMVVMVVMMVNMQITFLRTPVVISMHTAHPLTWVTFTTLPIVPIFSLKDMQIT